jgi:hypothetical protein
MRSRGFSFSKKVHGSVLVDVFSFKDDKADAQLLADAQLIRLMLSW